MFPYTESVLPLTDLVPSFIMSTSESPSPPDGAESATNFTVKLISHTYTKPKVGSKAQTKDVQSYKSKKIEATLLATTASHISFLQKMLDKHGKKYTVTVKKTFGFKYSLTKPKPRYVQFNFEFLDLLLLIWQALF